jgi:hypothetical protein
MNGYIPQRGDIRIHKNVGSNNWAASEWRGFAWVDWLNGYKARSYVDFRLKGHVLLGKDTLDEEYYRLA